MIIAVDPGSDVGVWVIRHKPSKVVIGREGPKMEMLAYIERVFRMYPGSAIDVVIEQFTLGREVIKMSRQHDAIEVIGAVKWIAHSFNAPVHMQTRSVKSRVSDAALKRLGWWCPGTDGHVHDAQRHALVFAAQCGSQYEHLVRQAFDIVDLPLE